MAHMWTELIAAATPYWNALIAAATSWLALRIYVLAAAGAIAIGSVWYAQTQSAEFFEMARKPGPPPTRLKTIQRHFDEASQFRRARTLTFLGRAARVIGFGFVVPSALLLLGLHHYAWFRPGAAPLLASNGCYSKEVQPSLWQTALFVASQLTMGVTESRLSGSLIAGTSRLHASESFLPADSVVGALVVFYRYFVGAFTTLVIRLGLSTFRAITTVESRYQTLKQALADAKRAALT
ncbi:MAG TPA: hypothetical protein VG960_00790 [Caulobacteraceae bacterium]|nr:hypothetical protein [Caulobacteraceae bacterium]